MVMVGEKIIAMQVDLWAEIYQLGLGIGCDNQDAICFQCLDTSCLVLEGFWPKKYTVTAL